jgi:hypothetical protein
MGEGLKRAFRAAALTRMTPRQTQVLEALSTRFERPGVIAQRAGIRTSSPTETVSKFCIQLVELGLAEKGGTPMFPMWRRAQEKIGGGRG